MPRILSAIAFLLMVMVVLYEMKLEAAGQYNTYVCVIFRTLRDSLVIAILDTVCKAMVFLREKIDNLCSRIKENPKKKQKGSYWTRRPLGKSRKITNK